LAVSQSAAHRSAGHGTKGIKSAIPYGVLVTDAPDLYLAELAWLGGDDVVARG
jgi:hypothetical protein